MIKANRVCSFVVAAIGIMMISCASAPKAPEVKPPQVRSGYAEVNGLKMYYEIHGDKGGVPLVLLHGGGSSIDVTWAHLIPYLITNRTVIAIDEQAHGRSGDRSGPVSFEQTADDVAALLKSLGIQKVDVMGFSNGATNALQVTLRHPQLVRKLVHISSFTKRSGAAPGFFDYMKTATFADMPQSLKDAYLKINPDQAALRNMHDKDAARMRSFKDIPDAKVREIKSATLIVQGDRDVSTPEHAVALSKLIKDSRLMIVPGGHGDFLGETSMAQPVAKTHEYTAGFINEFLAAPF
ncbi:alpha/beta fold hydrolase [Bdellovibrio sp. HCB290]|uniref:alpha/beta fold hydrolase n=1 Tax=Bdellovibrio sp. HCB290 TaxID=3394356 RepID=UPI0039B5B569